MRPFSHPEFRTYDFENVPLDRDVFLMDERWLAEYETSLLDRFAGKEEAIVGFISYAAVRSADQSSLELSWYPNIIDRFHEVSVRLPRTAFIACVDVPNWDDKPHIFVSSSWLSSLHIRPYTAFALVDAIGVKDALVRGDLGGQRLLSLRDRIDGIAAQNPGIAFISFADSLLMKTNWFVGQFDSEVRYSYAPESLLRLMPAVASAFREEIGLPVYAVVAQGANEYDDSALVHISSAGTHVSLNSLGLPFAQLLAIDEAVRAAIRQKRHERFELYIDQMFFHSLRFRAGFEKHRQLASDYSAPMATQRRQYYCANRDYMLSMLDAEVPTRRASASE